MLQGTEFEDIRIKGLEPRLERHIGDESPIDLVVTLNIRRRHMDDSQRALLTARLVPQLQRLEKGADGSLNLGTQGRSARAAALLLRTPPLIQVKWFSPAVLRRSFIAGLLATPALRPQERPAPPPAPQPPSPQIKVQVNVVNVPVSVLDASGRFIMDLDKKDFRVWDDGKEVEVRYFIRDPTQAVIVGFILDASNTARLYFKTYQEAIQDLTWALMPGDNQNKGFLVAYHTEPDFLVKPTGDAELIVEKIRKLKPGGGSAMLDAVYRSCNQYFKVRGEPMEPKRVLVLVGDGHDNASKVSLEQALEAAQRAQVVIYAVSTVAYGFHQPEEENLVRLAEETGGRIERPLQKVHEKVSGYLSTPSDEGNYAYKVGTGQYASELAGKLYKSITDVTGDITHQYVLGYTPPPFTDLKFRSVRVAVNLKDAEVKVRARKGYYPPLP